MLTFLHMPLGYRLFFYIAGLLAAVPLILRPIVFGVKTTMEGQQLVLIDALPNSGMQRTRNRLAFYPQSPVRAADAGR